MNSRVSSLSVDGIDPSVRERAEAAARRAGLSLNDWLNSTLGESSLSNFRKPAEPRSTHLSTDVADIHRRLEGITRQIEQIAQAPRRGDPVREQGVARQLSDALFRLDAGLAQISNPQGARHGREDRQRHAEGLERAAGETHRSSSPLSPSTLDCAIAQIAARQSEFDAPVPHAAPTAAQAPTGPNFSSLEQHLVRITGQIEALKPPSDIEESMAAFRNELCEIRLAILEAMPGRAIESLEGEVRALARRIDRDFESAADGQALANIERALGEIRKVLGSLTPAEQLAGHDEAIRELSAKLDAVLRANDDPIVVHGLESAIAALRAVVSNLASTDALARLSEEVWLLSTKVDQLTCGDNGHSLAALEQRIAALTSALESRSPPMLDDRSEHLEQAVRTLSERIDRLKVGDDSAATFAHIEQRVSHLIERIEASRDSGGGGNPSRVEDALGDILNQLERQHAALVRLADSTQRAPEPQDSGLADLVKRELSDLRFSHGKTSGHTEDSLKAVQQSLGHVADRLTSIEGDLRAARAAPPLARLALASVETDASSRRAALSAQPKPELSGAQAAFVAAPRNFHAATSPITSATQLEAVPPKPDLALSENLLAYAQPWRAAIAPELPPDHPLEPGTRPNGRAGSPSERVTAPEEAISEIPAAPKPSVSSSSFIAAARRAARAAAAQAAPEKGRASAQTESNDQAKDDLSSITAKLRSVLLGASVLVIVLGGFKMARPLLDGSDGGAPQTALLPGDQSPWQRPAQNNDKQGSPEQAGRQALNNASPSPPDAGGSVSTEMAQSHPVSPDAGSEITGTIPPVQLGRSGEKLASIPPGEALPDGIGGQSLRAAALKGDPAAAYEVAVRFAEGRGVAPNLEEAAKWYERAAQADVIPAIFRLGTLYQKGLGVKKDIDMARRYYVQAAECGNAKAMHNVAVLDADGGDKSADYKSAAQWFRKAADRGIAESQFNLGILYARGIGVDQNLVESFKWLSLAAAQGDAEATRKRDDVAKRLDTQSLAAAKLVIHTFVIEPQPDDAVSVATPSGGWDSAPSPAAVAKPPARSALTKRTAAR
ncbi:MAG: SEL1-like repeat protein [Bradyrhizobium sp.]|nr:SEL1-like repeat protein [Bradyrhizobium sp.]